MLEKWSNKLRQSLLYRLRPGRDQQELLELFGRAESIHSDEHRGMLERLVTFRDMRVRELMIPRLDMKSLKVNQSLESAVQSTVEMGYTRLPVYREDLDHIQGIVHAWDLFSAQAKKKKRDLESLLRPCLKVPESQLALGLLSRMQREGSHMTIVIDEYGGTAGLVTMSDLLSEIVGSMDESVDHDEEAECAPQGDGSYVVQARMQVEDLEAALHCTLPDGDFDTVGGLVITHCGHIPAPGERFTIANLIFTVMEATPRRVQLLRVGMREKSE